MITILLLKTFELFLLSKASWSVRQSTILVLSWKWPRSCVYTNSFWQKPCKLTPDNYLWNFPKHRLEPWQILHTYRKAQRRWLLLVEYCQLQGCIMATGDMLSQGQNQYPNTHCQEETCFENTLRRIVPKTWHLSSRTSVISGYVSASSDSADFYPSSTFSERNRTFACIYGWRQVDRTLTSKAAIWKINCHL